ncbi:unnamed protein product, partial [Mesorhabditis belari]|uniref:DNA topoisomerase n=1 Tax=Mesorhabditis belari TaxID=2138241 RepID=A0AAF3FFF5_9BILA
MRRVLFVAEKNDVAKGISNILSKGQSNRRDGFSKYNKIYSFPMEFHGQQSVIATTSVSGHLMNMDFGPEMRDWQNVSIERLFDAPICSTVNAEMKDIERTLVQEARSASTLVLWTDCDREGENIGDEIRRACIKANPKIDVYRAKFSEVTAAAIYKALRELKRLDMNIVNAVYCRMELDLRIGSAFTRLQTLHLRRCFAALLGGQNKQVISYGSCQFPTLGFVVERYKTIENFIKEKFWKLSVEHVKDDSKTEFIWDRERLFDKTIVELLRDDCIFARTARVENIISRQKNKWRPAALDTVEFEKLAVRKLRLSAKVAMGIAEKLYSTGWISYPRTETNKFPPNINLANFVDMQKDNPMWGSFAQGIINAGGPTPRNGSKSDQAHPPIHPLKAATRDQLHGDEWRVYELVVRHFLACVSKDAHGLETRISLRIGGERFTTTGLQIEDLGYLVVYPYDKWTDKALPKYNYGETFENHKVLMSESQTQPPPLLTEADLIALMDKFGIGTDATHAEHIEKIKERQYVGVNPTGHFIPGYLGLSLVDGYDAMGFAMSKPQMRANLEQQLVLISQGARTKDEVLKEQLQRYRRIFIIAETKINNLSQAFSRYMNNNQNPRNPGGGGGNLPRGGHTGGTSTSSTTRGAGSSNFNRGTSRNGPDDVSNQSRKRQGDASDKENTVPHYEMVLDQPQQGRSTRGRGRGRGINRGGGSGTGTRATNSALPLCKCKIPSVEKTTTKEGVNKGRKFYTCSKEINAPDHCNFFLWQPR